MNMQKEYETLIEKKDLNVLDVMTFLSNYGGSYSGAKMASGLLDRVNREAITRNS